MTIGERIKAARTNANMTQADLARAMGVPYQTIGHWERDASSPKFSSLEKVAKALNISIETLILGDTASQKVNKPNPMVAAIERVVGFLGISYDELLQRANFDPTIGTGRDIHFSDDGSPGLTLVQLGKNGRDGVLYLPDNLLLALKDLNREAVEAVCDVATRLAGLVACHREEPISDCLDSEPPESPYDLLRRDFQDYEGRVYKPSWDPTEQPFGPDNSTHQVTPSE